MKTYPLSLLAGIALAITITVFTSCGENKGAPNTAGTEVSADDEADDKAMQTKMTPYVDVINSVSKPINKGYAHYLKFADVETGEERKKGVSISFLSEIRNLDAKLAAVEKAAQTEPKADIDQYAAAYVTKAKAALALHNQLAAYYSAKENLMDNGAKGKALHKDYVAALTDFKATALQVADAYDKYYKDGNVKYLAKLQKKGDVIRLAANHLMNEAELIKDNFYSAIPNEGPVTATPELDAVMTQTSKFQELISAYNTAEQSTSEENKKKFFRAGTSFSSFGSDAKSLLTNIRSAIDKIKKGADANSWDYDYKGVAEEYEDMIEEFNRNQF